jgi:maleylacetoacetate isomerase
LVINGPQGPETPLPFFPQQQTLARALGRSVLCQTRTRDLIFFSLCIPMDRNPHPLRLLTQSRNSAGERVRIALNLKGLAYEYVSIAAMEPKDYREINPQGLMPALMVGESVFAQSTAILEYLEEVYPARPLLPSDPVKRAEVRAFASLISSDTHPLCNYRIRKYLANELGATDTAILAWYRNWIGISFTALEKTIARRARQCRYCFGDGPGWADLHLIPMIANARRFDCDLGPYPRLLEIESYCVELDAFRLARPDAQPDYRGKVDSIIGPG